MSPAHHGRYVAYYRVSTDRQGRTALGIDAQKEKVKAFLDGGRWQLVKSFTETESGKRSDRPELRKALDYCKRNKGTKLVVATLSRLTRDTKFLLTLIDGSVDVVFTDLPQVPPGAMGRFFLTMMAAVAEFEAGLTSERTKAALAQVKARGEKRLGNPKPRGSTAQGRGSAVIALHRGHAQHARHSDGAGQDVDGDAGVQRAGTGGGVNMIDDLSHVERFLIRIIILGIACVFAYRFAAGAVPGMPG
jgi:DNA invertase Pin-like site-specific DNA recombinase